MSIALPPICGACPNSSYSLQRVHRQEPSLPLRHDPSHRHLVPTAAGQLSPPSPVFARRASRIRGLAPSIARHLHSLPTAHNTHAIACIVDWPTTCIAHTEIHSCTLPLSLY